MDPKMNRQRLYEIYRSCRLCGAGAGYKMPIVQDIIVMDDVDVDLRTKIKECVKIEVNLNDRMPPLICEVCIDKVNSFYDFLQLCNKTNEKTRLKLGLPLPTTSKDAADGESILGVMEPILPNNDSEGEAAGKSKPLKKVKTENKEPEVKVKIEKDVPSHTSKSNISRSQSSSTKQTRSSRGMVSPPREKTPPRITRRIGHDTDDMTLSKLIEEPKRSKPGPKPVMKKEMNPKKEEPPRGVKRYSRELLGLLGTPPVKKTRITEVSSLMPMSSTRTPPRTATRPSPKPSNHPQRSNVPTRRSSVLEKTSQRHNSSVASPKETRLPQRKINPPVKLTQPPVKTTNPPKKTSNPPLRETKPPVKERIPPEKKTDPLICIVCDITFRGSKDQSNHMKRHTVSYTSSNKACNACQEWFTNYFEALRHHADHRDKDIPYRCMMCSTDFETNQLYENHIKNNECRTSTEVPDVKCEQCWKYFPTKPLLQGHRCWGVGDRPAMCIICNDIVAARYLKKHEKDCKPKKGMLDSAQVEQAILDRLKPMQVRVARCDPLLKVMERGHFDVSTVRCPYGLDRHYNYPYVSVKPRTEIKTETITPHNQMVTINDVVKAEFDYVHWDSDDGEVKDSNNIIDGIKKNVPNLTCLCLKVIYSPTFLGKVPKRRRVQMEGFDDNHDFEVNIDNVMDKLKDDDGNEKGGDEKIGDSPKLGIITHYTSLVDIGEEYDSDSIINDCFRGFQSTSNSSSICNRIDRECNNSDESQSLLSNTIKDLLKNNRTDSNIEEKESSNNLETLHTIDGDLTKANNIKDTETNTAIDKNEEVCNVNNDTKNNSECPENNSSNINSFNDFENKDITTDNIESISKDFGNISVRDSKFSSHEDLGMNGRNKVYNIIEHSDENDNQNVDCKAKDNGSEDNTTGVNKSGEVSKVKSRFDLQNKELKETVSATYSSDERCPIDNTPIKAINVTNENKETVKDLSDDINKNLGSVNSQSVKEDKDTSGIDSVGNTNHSESLKLNEQVDRISGQINQSIEVNTVGLTDENFVQNNESVNIVKESVSSVNETLSSDNKNFDNLNDIRDSKEVFKMLNERIAHIKQCQVNETVQEVDSSDFLITDNDSSKSNDNILISELNKSPNDVQPIEDNVDRGNDNVNLQNDNIQHENVLDNVKIPKNEYNKENLNAISQNLSGNDKIIDKEKVSLDDLMKIRDAELEGMDLDNISDDDFNFD